MEYFWSLGINRKNTILLTKIKTLRKEKHLSQQQFAEILGLEQSAYSKIESGKTHLSLNTFLRICEILGVKPDDILPISKDNSKNNSN